MSKSTFNNINVATGKAQINSGFIGDEMVIFERFEDLAIVGLPRRTDGIIMGIVKSGNATFTVDTETRNIKRGDIIVISDHQVIADYQASDDFTGQAIILSRSFFDEAVKGMTDLTMVLLFTRAHPVVSVTDKQMALFSNYFLSLLIKIQETENIYRREIVRGLFTMAIYDFCNIVAHTMDDGQEQTSRGNAIFVQFLRLVEENSKRERRVSWYAEQLCISAKYLSEVIKHVSHRTPSEWIDNYVLLEMRVLLRNTTMSIKEISQELNFPNQSFLGKFFKERIGVSPYKYRKGEEP